MTPKTVYSSQPTAIAVLRYGAVSFFLAACYFGAAWLGLTFAIPPGNATVVWPASGLAVGAVYLLGDRFCPAIWIGAFLADLSSGVSVGVASSFATGNTIEAVFAAWLLKRFLSEGIFVGAKDPFIFILAAAAACVPAATFGALTLLQVGRIGMDAFGTNWITWFLGDLMGVVIIFPMVLAIAARRWWPVTLPHLLELSLLFILQVGLSFFLFGGLLPQRLAEQVLYLPMVLLIWCSLRFGMVEVTASTFLFSVAAVWGAWAGVGVYGSATPHEALFDLKLLLFAYATTALVLCSIVAEARRANSSSETSHAELQRQTCERRRLEKWFRHLLTASPDALIISDANGRILLVNEAAEKLFGYPGSELVGQSVEILVPDHFRETHAEQRQGFTESPHPRLMGSELVARRKDGSVFDAEIALGPMRTDDGLIVFSAIRDISARKTAEKALKDSEERFALAMEGTDAGIWDWDLRTDDVYFSPKWKSMLGYAEDELEHEFREWEVRLHPEDRERALQTVREYLEGKSSEYELEHRLLHKDGSYRWILARGVAICDESGKPYRMAGSHHDITERKGMEETLRLQLAHLIAAEEMQTHLLPKAPPEIPGLEVAGKCFTAEFAAGDQFDFLSLQDGTFVTLIGDVSGHGVGPAILMAFLHAHLRSLAAAHSDLCTVINRANNVLEQESPEQRFVTLLAAAFNVESRTLTYCSCGHPPGFIMNREGKVSAWMDHGNLPLGIVPNVRYCHGPPLPLNSGDVVVMMTDGILEARSPEKVLFGSERTVQLVREHRHEPAAQIVESCRAAVRDFTQRTTLTDDLTLVVVKVE
jgi:PAS domain S-box-containing protein